MSPGLLNQLNQHWGSAPYHLRKALYDFTRYPMVGQNNGYMVGYLAALHNAKLLDHDAYTFWLTYTGWPLNELIQLWEQTA